MFGEHVHRLRVLLEQKSSPDTSSTTTAFEKEGNYGDNWNYGQVTLNLTTQTTVSDITGARRHHVSPTADVSYWSDVFRWCLRLWRREGRGMTLLSMTSNWPLRPVAPPLQSQPKSHHPQPRPQYQVHSDRAPKADHTLWPRISWYSLHCFLLLLLMMTQLFGLFSLIGPADCGGPFDLWEPNTTFSSPNYPHSYGHKAKCEYLLYRISFFWITSALHLDQKGSYLAVANTIQPFRPAVGFDLTFSNSPITCGV